MNSLGLAPFTTSSRIIQQPHASPEQAEDERLWLLSRLKRRGPQSTTMEFAKSFIFPDVLMVFWANANAIGLEFYSLPMGCKMIPFVRFTLKDEPEVADWFTEMQEDWKI